MKRRKQHRLLCFLVGMAYTLRRMEVPSFDGSCVARLPSFLIPETAPAFQRFMEFCLAKTLGFEGSVVHGTLAAYVENPSLEWGEIRLETPRFLTHQELFFGSEEIFFSELLPRGENPGKHVYCSYRSCFDKILGALCVEFQEHKNLHHLGIQFIPK